MNQRATLEDVARLAGVSRSAVSLALRDSPRISVAKKAEIRATADRLGYVPSSAGRALRAQRAGAVALVIPNTSNHIYGHPYFTHLLVGVTDAAQAHDSVTLVATNDDDQGGVTAYERVLRSGAADGAIVTSAAAADPNVSRMVHSSLPVVLVGRFPNLPTALSVGIDDEGAARMVTEHLLSHGYRRIGHISGPLDHQAAIDRYAGFRRALSQLGEPTLQVHAQGDFSEESGRLATRELLDQAPSLEAIFAANDEMAYGALLELRARGLSVPQDVALAGFDDFGISRLTTPGITTITVPAEQLGRTAGEKLFASISRSEPAEHHTVLPVELLVRDSCGQHDVP